MKKIRVGIICGGQSAEHEVSLQSAKNIIEAIDRKKYDVVVIGRRGASMLKEFIYGSVAWKVAHHLHGCVIWIVE